MQTEIPSDFPRDPDAGCLPGAVPKFLARQIGGKYVVGLTAEEVAERYAACLELTNDMVEYYHRKMREHPEWTHDFLIERIRTGLDSERANLGLSIAEHAWIVGRTAAATAGSQEGG